MKRVSYQTRLFFLVLLAFNAGLAVRADYPTTVLSQGPLGYWRLSETTRPSAPQPAVNIGNLGTAGNGQYLYDATRGEPGAIVGSSDPSVRFFNPNLDVAYAGSKVEVPYNAALNPNGPFTVEFWAKANRQVVDVFCPIASLDSDTSIAPTTNANTRAGWLFYQNGSTNNTTNVWQFRIGNASDYLDGDAIKGGIVTTGAWQHIVGVFNGSAASLYVNGVQVASKPIKGYQANGARPFRIGSTCFNGSLGTFAGNRGFDGWLDEVAFYDTALNASDIAAHYSTAKTNGIAYISMVFANNPVGYWRLGEPGSPAALNLGSLGGSANGHYIYGVNPGQPGPQPPAFSGLETTNRACGFNGSSGYVDLPPLNLNTNTVTITAWVLANTIQTNNAGIVFCDSGTTVAGLKFDISDPNGLSYNWNNDSSAASFKSYLTVPVSKWSYMALIVQPDQAILCLHDGTAFSTSTNYITHPEQSFDGHTLIGADIQSTNLTFNGLIDEVAVFNRALSVGEVYSQYAAAVGGQPPVIYTDVVAPADTPYVGDTLTLSIDAGGTPPLTYQWRKNGNPIAGAAASTLTLTKVTAADSASYDVIITNGKGSVTSQAAKVIIQPILAPTINQDPQGRTLYAGGWLNLSVLATGGDLHYQWQQAGTNLPNATNATYQVANVGGTNAGTYVAVVSNPLGTVKSAAATINVIVPPADSYEATITSDAPESWWRLDEPSGTAILTDAMGRHDGVYKGGVTLRSAGVLVGSTNAAAVFDGSSGYAEVPFSKALNTTNFTIECWVKANPIVEAQCPVSSFTQPPGRGYMIQKSGDGVWNYLFGDGVDRVMYFFPGGDAIYGKWVHIAATFDGTNYLGYVNGKLDAGANIPIVPNNVAPLRIGYDQSGNGWSDFWSGGIDEVAYYPKALTRKQLAAHYAAGLYGTTSKPVFTQQPLSETDILGSNHFFFTSVDGSLPLSFQWSKDGAPIPGGTNATLVVTNLSYTNSGVYTLAASNLVGVTTSTPATLTVGPSPTFINLTNGLVLHLKFDRNYLDSSGRANNAQAVGSPRFVNGKIGSGALHYSTAVDNSDPNNIFVTAASYATLGKKPDLQFGSNVNFSISYWVRFTGSPGDLPFFCNSINAFTQPGYTLAPSYGAGGWSWSLGTSGTSSYVGIYGSSGTINDGLWHHLVHIFDRSGSGLTYLDGQFDDSRSVVGIGNLDTGEVTNIGQDASGAYPEAGQTDIDDVGVWRRILTDYEVAAIYLVGQSGKSFDTYGPVSLKVNYAAGAIELLWEAGTLQQADDLLGPWSPVVGATAPYYKFTPGATALKKFYRIQL